MTGALRPLRLVAGVALVAWCWVSASFPPFTTAVDVAVGGLIVVMAAVGWWGSPGRGRPPGRDTRTALRWRQIWPWVVVASGLFAVELTAELAQPRRDHPTLSSIVGTAMGSHVGRTAVMVLWFAIGWYLFAPRRTDP